MKKIIIGALCVMGVLSTSAFAQSAPLAISKDAVEDYVRSRLVSPRGAIIRADGELYPVSATINGKDWTGWAMDIRLNARHALSHRSGLSRHTVLVSQKEPVAMRRDTKKFRRLD